MSWCGRSRRRRSARTRRRGSSAARAGARPTSPRRPASLGAAVRLICRVGADPLGEQLVAALTSAGVDVRAQRAGRTGAVVVLVDGTGERTMLPDRAAAGELSDVDPAWLDGVTWLHVPAYSLLSEPIGAASLELVAHVRTRRRHGERRRLLGLRDRVVRHGPVRRTARRRPAGRRVRQRARVGAGRRSTGRGSRSSSAAPSRSRCWATPRPLNRTTFRCRRSAASPDTTGAGDAFAAGYIAASMAGAGIGDSVRAGIRVAGAALTARPGSGP